MNIQMSSRQIPILQIRRPRHQNPKTLIRRRLNGQLRQAINARQFQILIDVQVCAVAEIDRRHGEDREYLVGGWDFTTCVEGSQFAAAAESAAHAELLGLLDVEYSRARICDS